MNVKLTSGSIYFRGLNILSPTDFLDKSIIEISLIIHYLSISKSNFKHKTYLAEYWKLIKSEIVEFHDLKFVFKIPNHDTFYNLSTLKRRRIQN